MNPDKTEVPTEIREEFDALSQNAVDLLPAPEFATKLVRARREKKPLRIKYGADPSAPDIHLGHSVPIRKLKQFQDWGHQVVFIIGDYTARIGDPSGKNAARPRLTKEQVDANAQTYLDQIFKILDREKTEVVYNSQWLETMDVTATIALMARYTVSQMLEREDFHNRYETEVPIYIHEFIYPLLQGYDSIAVRADLELGGTDQKFNLLVGRELQRQDGMDTQCIMTLPLLVGTDGVSKMSKSLGNYIGISEAPGSMFGKAMSIPDSVMWDYFELAAGVSSADTARMRSELELGRMHPRDLKEDLAKRITAMYHDEVSAEREAADFRSRFTLREFPEESAEQIEFTEDTGLNLVELVRRLGAAKSVREAQRLVEQGGVRIIDDPEPHPLTAHPEPNSLAYSRVHLVAGTYRIKIGKKRFVLLQVS